MPTLRDWCFALFFLWYGLAAFVPALNTDMFRKIGAVLALIVGVVSLLVLLGMGQHPLIDIQPPLPGRLYYFTSCLLRII